MPHVALYCRISQDKAGRREGVEAQEKWGRAYATRAWPDLPVVVYPDNDISAANGDHRPGYEALRQAVVGGDVAQLWAVEQSRLERTEIGWFGLAAELDAAGITELHTNRDGIVRVRDEVAGIKAVLAASEVRKLTRRIRDKLDVLAAEGRPAGKPPFGYRLALDDDGKPVKPSAWTQHPAEAEAIRWAADKVLAGWSLAQIATELTDRGLTGAQGGALTANAVKQIITRPAIAGRRVQRGEDVGKATWDAILDKSTWQAVRTKLSAPRTITKSDGSSYELRNTQRHTGRRYLLSGGVAICGVCDAPLNGSVIHNRGKPKPYYLCHPRNGGKACVGILGEATEEHVVAELLDQLDRPEFLEALTADDHGDHREKITTALGALDGRRGQLAGLWGRGELRGDEWAAARDALDDEERRLRGELSSLPVPADTVDPAQLRQAWASMTLGERREVVGMFIDRVVVNRAIPGARVFNPARIDIVWRTAQA